MIQKGFYTDTENQNQYQTYDGRLWTLKESYSNAALKGQAPTKSLRALQAIQFDANL